METVYIAFAPLISIEQYVPVRFDSRRLSWILQHPHAYPWVDSNPQNTIALHKGFGQFQSIYAEDAALDGFYPRAATVVDVLGAHAFTFTSTSPDSTSPATSKHEPYRSHHDDRVLEFDTHGFTPQSYQKPARSTTAFRSLPLTLSRPSTRTTTHNCDRPPTLLPQICAILHSISLSPTSCHCQQLCGHWRAQRMHTEIAPAAASFPAQLLQPWHIESPLARSLTHSSTHGWCASSSSSSPRLSTLEADPS